ncbi:hypothetical protein GYB22_05770 [bacterium]|nr:hypothetical protein [bacterium]
MSINTYAQNMQIHAHPNNGKYAISKNDSLITDYVYSEVSTFSEGIAFVSKGEHYAYIDTNARELCPYLFVVAGDFKDGYAIAGDSNYIGLINAKMQVVVPFRFRRIFRPNMGLIIVQSMHDLWGAYNEFGDVKIPAIYDLPPLYNDLEHIIVVQNGLYGVINDCNETVFNTSYQYISLDGLAYRSGKYLRIFEMD